MGSSPMMIAWTTWLSRRRCILLSLFRASSSSSSIYFIHYSRLILILLRHEKGEVMKEQEGEKEVVAASNITRTRYLCEECDRFFLFTPPEILKHKKIHV